MEFSKDSPACQLTVTLTDEAATLDFGRRLSALLRAGDCILFEGDLGMGKTTMIRGLLSGVATQHGLSKMDVPSPTFTLVQIYPFPDLTFYHYDLYRLPEDDNESALVEIGFDESLNDGVALVEWPERLGHATPKDALRLVLKNGATEDDRICVLHGPAQWSSRLEGLVT